MNESDRQLLQVQQLLNKGEVKAAASVLHNVVVTNQFTDQQVESLSNIALTLGQLHLAVKLARAAADCNESSVVRRIQLIKVLMFARRHHEAKIECDKVLAVKGDNTEALYLLGYSHLGVGEFVEAEACFRRVLVENPATMPAITGLSKCRKFNEDAGEVLTLFRSAFKYRLSGPDQACVYHAMAKVYNDCGEYEQAWRHVANANALLKLDAPFRQHQQLKLHIDKLISLYERPSALRKDVSGPHPVLIAGMPRSGTTLMEQILSCHPDFHPGGEVPAIDYALAYGTNGRNRYTFLDIASTECEEFCAAYAEYFLQMGASSRQRIVTKHLEGYLDIGLMRSAFPGAKFIYMQRDDMDVAASVFFEFFNSPGSFANDLSDIFYVQQQLKRMMSFWCTQFPADILVVRYEDLVREFEPTLQSVCVFLNIDRADIGDYTQSSNQVETPSLWQVRQGIYQSSIGRWRRYSVLRALAEKMGTA